MTASEVKDRNLTRYWLEFQGDDLPPGLSWGCGVTAYTEDDALSLVKNTYFEDSDLLRSRESSQMWKSPRSTKIMWLPTWEHPSGEASGGHANLTTPNRERSPAKAGLLLDGSSYALCFPRPRTIRPRTTSNPLRLSTSAVANCRSGPTWLT